jgi:hypothetical protein
MASGSGALLPDLVVGEGEAAEMSVSMGQPEG